METMNAILARRNVREFSERSIDAADLERILEAGRRAPSAKNWQPWDFVVVSERATLVELAKVWVYGTSVAQAAATIVQVGPIIEDEVTRGWLQFDHGQAMMSMMIEAASLGIGSGHSAVGDQELLRSLLGVPDDRFAVALMPLGYPRVRPLEPIARPNRKALSEIVHDERW